MNKKGKAVPLPPSSAESGDDSDFLESDPALKQLKKMRKGQRNDEPLPQMHSHHHHWQQSPQETRHQSSQDQHASKLEHHQPQMSEREVQHQPHLLPVCPVSWIPPMLPIAFQHPNPYVLAPCHHGRAVFPPGVAAPIAVLMTTANLMLMFMMFGQWIMKPRSD